MKLQTHFSVVLAICSDSNCFWMAKFAKWWRHTRQSTEFPVSFYNLLPVWCFEAQFLTNRSSAEMADSKDYETTYKILVLGDSGVGKSCLIFRFTEDIFSDSYISTIGKFCWILGTNSSCSRVLRKNAMILQHEYGRSIQHSLYSRTFLIRTIWMGL